MQSSYYGSISDASKYKAYSFIGKSRCSNSLWIFIVRQQSW